MAAHTHQFTLTGGVRDIADGEVFAGKGVLLTRLKTPDRTVAFYNTHVRDRGVHSCVLGYRVIAPQFFSKFHPFCQNFKREEHNVSQS